MGFFVIFLENNWSSKLTLMMSVIQDESSEYFNGFGYVLCHPMSGAVPTSSIIFPSVISNDSDSNSSPIKNDKNKYQWIIPDIMHSHINILCTGYIRQFIDTKFVGNDVIKLLILYYRKDTDILLENIKETNDTDKAFISPIFCIQSFRFYIKLYPFGSDQTQGMIYYLYI